MGAANGTGSHDPELRDHPLGAVVGDDPDAVAGTHAQREQTRRDLSDRGGVALPGPLRRRAGLLQGRSVGPLRRVVQEAIQKDVSAHLGSPTNSMTSYRTYGMFSTGLKERCMPTLTSTVRDGSPAFRENAEHMGELLNEVRALEEQVRKTSAAKRAKFEARGKLLPRERVARLPRSRSSVS